MYLIFWYILYFRCICSVGLQYQNTFHASFDSMRVSDIVGGFPFVSSSKVRNCGEARDSCQVKCQQKGRFGKI